MTLREIRAEAGFTKYALARRSGVCTRTLFAIERGKVQARMDTRRRILRALKKPMAEHLAIFGPLPHPPTERPCRLRRQALGLNQSEVAEAAGVSTRAVIRIELGQHRPQMALRRRLCIALAIPFEEHRRYFGPMRGEKAS
jgi:DNA-binding XRE family transcriptional regulator